MSVFLIGLPGSGKSTLGAGLAGALNVPFCDMDEWIEGQSGRSIPELFAQGEAMFRALESLAVEALAGKRMVVACGGGVVLRPDNRRVLRAGGLVIWIDRPVDQILLDIDISGRPLLAQGRDKLLALDRQRRPLYQQTAHLHFVNRDTPAKALEQLKRLVEEGA